MRWGGGWSISGALRAFIGGGGSAAPPLRAARKLRFRYSRRYAKFSYKERYRA
jgi:hypothetical protein